MQGVMKKLNNFFKISDDRPRILEVLGLCHIQISVAVEGTILCNNILFVLDGIA